MQGKAVLMASVAAIALIASGNAANAKMKHKASAPPPAAQTAPAPVVQNGPTNQELADRLSALEAELAAEHDARGSDHNRLSALEQNFNDTSWTFDNSRPTVKSGDGRFTLAFRARFQFDTAVFFQDSPTTSFAQFKDLGSGSVVRRAYFGIEGKAFNDFWYEFRLNGGGSDGGSAGAAGVPSGGEGDPLVNIARVQYNGIPNFRINVGIIEPIQSLDGSISSGQLIFLERAEIENIAADAFGGGDSRRGIEATFQKTDIFRPGDSLVISGAYTGGKTGSNAGHGNFGDEATQAIGRVAYRIWSDGISNVQIGGSGGAALYSGANNTSNPNGVLGLRFRDRPEIRVDGTRLIDTGGINARTGDYYGFDAAANFQNFYVGGEYMNFTADRLASGVAPNLKAADHPSFSGWFVEGTWVLTGETRQYSPSAMNNEYGAFNAPRVANPFSFRGDSWGAWEIAVRYSDTDLNWQQNFAGTSTIQAGIAGGEERIVAIGLNWYLNQNIRIMIDDNIVNVKKLSAPGANPAIHANQIGQDFNEVGARVQFQM
jgi:phosphate-selective porin OprO/OprP